MRTSLLAADLGLTLARNKGVGAFAFTYGGQAFTFGGVTFTYGAAS